MSHSVQTSFTEQDGQGEDMHPNTLEVPWCFDGQVGQSLTWVLTCEIYCVGAFFLVCRAVV